MAVLLFGDKGAPVAARSICPVGAIASTQTELSPRRVRKNPEKGHMLPTPDDGGNRGITGDTTLHN